MVYLNIAGFRSHFDELKLLVEEVRPKIVILSETHVTSSHDVGQFAITNYNQELCLSRSAHTGGIWIYIEEQLKYDVVSNTVFGDNWFLAVEVKSGAIYGLFGGVYHSPSTSDVQFIKDFEILLNDVLIDEKTNVIVGDFNIRWDESGCATELKNVTDAAGLVQKVREATRTGPRSSTMIDLVFTNSECCEANIEEEMKISDHETIGINIGGPVRISVPEKNKTRVSWRRYSKDRNDPTLIERGGSVDEDAERLSNALISAVNQLSVILSKLDHTLGMVRI